MKNIKIYLHKENCKEAELIEIDENQLIDEVTIKVPGEEIHLFIEDEDNSKQLQHNCTEAGIKDRDHVHCHRCHTVTLVLEYNGKEKSISLSPSATGRRILRKASELFDITEGDASKLKLMLPGDIEMDKLKHIGQFTEYPKCEVKIIQSSDTKVEG